MNSKDYADRLSAVMAKYPHASYVKLIETLEDAWDADATLYTCGNGGSAATASHMVADFANLCGWPIQCLNDNIPRLTAEANDRQYEDIFAAALRPLLKKQDVVIAFSGSGQSENVCLALQYARALCRTVALTGRGGGRLAPLAHVALIVPSDDMQLIEDTHLITVHMLTQYFQQRSVQ